MSHTSQTALITGASSGIGRALAHELASLGYRVALAARRLDLLTELVDEITSNGHTAMAIKCDVIEHAQVREAVAMVNREWGEIDLAIANAGVGLPTKASRFSIADAETMMRVNFLGTLYLFDAVIPAMIARGSGQFVGIASLAGFRGLPGSSVYSASKAATRAFLEAVRVELAPLGIAVTVVNPGFVRTAMTAKNRFHMPFLLEPEEAARRIAAAVLRKDRELEFPRRLSIPLRLARLLPNMIYDRLLSPYARREIDQSKLRR